MAESVKDGLTCYAGWTMDGIRSVVEGPEGRARMARWVDEIGRPKGRHDVGAFITAMGLRAVLTWLYAVRGRAGSAWPGEAHKKAANTGFGVPAESGKRMSDWRWALAEMDRIVQESRDAAAVLPTVASTVVPALMAAAARRTNGKGTEAAALWTTLSATDAETLKNQLMAHSRIGGLGPRAAGVDLELPLPIGFRDGEDRVWVDLKSLASWYEREGAGRNGAEARVTGSGALRDQFDALADDPDWAVYVEHKGGGRSYERPGFRAGRRGTARMTYRRFNAEVSAALLG